VVRVGGGRTRSREYRGARGAAWFGGQAFADPELARDVLADLREHACLVDIRNFARW
jgi:hypothetical protein